MLSTAIIAFLPVAAAAGAVAATLRANARLTRLAAALEACIGDRGVTGSAMRRLTAAVASAREMLVELEHRAPRRHPVTGLETREIILARIAADGGIGSLGVIELHDFDALTAQDLSLADRVLRIFADKAVRMTGSDRLIAQIDRARIAIWFGGSGDPAREFEALCYALRDRIEAPGIDLIPRIATACVASDREGAEGNMLLSRAIAQLGRASAGVVGQGRHEDAELRLKLEHELRQAVARHQFSLRYQPFIDAGRGVVCGAEALIRWHHPELGLVSPAIFMPVVERTGLAEEIGLWVLDRAIADAAGWRHATGCDLKVAVNLSAHQLVRDSLDTVIDRMLARHGLGAELLELELTETVAAVDSTAALALFDRLRGRRIGIAIDDFGAGYSSLSYLKKLNFDKLKIDREFVTGVDTDRQSQAICQSIIALGRGLGITVLAEGAERVEEYVWLRRHGCRFFQGFFFSKPLDSSKFVAFVAAKDALSSKIDLGPNGLQHRVGASIA